MGDLIFLLVFIFSKVQIPLLSLRLISYNTYSIIARGLTTLALDIGSAVILQAPDLMEMQRPQDLAPEEILAGVVKYGMRGLLSLGSKNLIACPESASDCFVLLMCCM